MTSKWSRRELLRRSALATTCGLGGCGTSLLGRSSTELVRQYEAELDRFADVGTATSGGYHARGRYVQTDRGASGIPLVNREVNSLDPTEPHAVLYNLTEDGRYEPLGLKWFVGAGSRSSPPSLFGMEFDGPIGANSPWIPEHYALHVWLFRENPDGLFATYNPSIDPPSFVEELGRAYQRLSDVVIGTSATETGYRNTEKCIAMPDGGYGVPFVSTDDDTDGGTDPKNPPVLLYRLTPNWVYLLAGAEWYVPSADRDTPPSLFGQQFHEPMAGHSTQTSQPEHYGLHAWLLRANPRGTFVPYNPSVSC